VQAPQTAESAPARVRDKPTWLISRAYARSTGLLREGFEADADGLRSYHYRLLAALDEWGPASQADLGRGTSLDRSDVTATLGQLESRGLVERSVDPENRRRNIVSITRDGTTRLNALDHVLADIQDKLLAPLTPTEQRQFLKMLRRIVDPDVPNAPPADLPR
jgi:DNA-binding MarR family transcriptional regulator